MRKRNSQTDSEQNCLNDIFNVLETQKKKISNLIGKTKQGLNSSSSSDINSNPDFQSGNGKVTSTASILNEIRSYESNAEKINSILLRKMSSLQRMNKKQQQTSVDQSASITCQQVALQNIKEEVKVEQEKKTEGMKGNKFRNFKRRSCDIFDLKQIMEGEKIAKENEKENIQIASPFSKQQIFQEQDNHGKNKNEDEGKDQKQKCQFSQKRSIENRRLLFQQKRYSHQYQQKIDEVQIEDSVEFSIPIQGSINQITTKGQSQTQLRQEQEQKSKQNEASQNQSSCDVSKKEEDEGQRGEQINEELNGCVIYIGQQQINFFQCDNKGTYLKEEDQQIEQIPNFSSSLSIPIDSNLNMISQQTTVQATNRLSDPTFISEDISSKLNSNNFGEVQNNKICDQINKVPFVSQCSFRQNQVQSISKQLSPSNNQDTNNDSKYILLSSISDKNQQQFIKPKVFESTFSKNQIVDESKIVQIQRDSLPKKIQNFSMQGIDIKKSGGNKLSNNSRDLSKPIKSCGEIEENEVNEINQDYQSTGCTEPNQIFIFEQTKLQKCRKSTQSTNYQFKTNQNTLVPAQKQIHRHLSNSHLTSIHNSCDDNISFNINITSFDKQEQLLPKIKQGSLKKQIKVEEQQLESTSRKTSVSKTIQESELSQLKSLLEKQSFKKAPKNFSKRYRSQSSNQNQCLTKQIEGGKNLNESNCGSNTSYFTKDQNQLTNLEGSNIPQSLSSINSLSNQPTSNKNQHSSSSKQPTPSIQNSIHQLHFKKRYPSCNLQQLPQKQDSSLGYYTISCSYSNEKASLQNKQQPSKLKEQKEIQIQQANSDRKRGVQKDRSYYKINQADLCSNESTLCFELSQKSGEGTKDQQYFNQNYYSSLVNSKTNVQPNSFLMLYNQPSICSQSSQQLICPSSFNLVTQTHPFQINKETNNDDSFQIHNQELSIAMMNKENDPSSQMQQEKSQKNQRRLNENQFHNNLSNISQQFHLQKNNLNVYSESQNMQPLLDNYLKFVKSGSNSKQNDSKLKSMPRPPSSPIKFQTPHPQLKSSFAQQKTKCQTNLLQFPSKSAHTSTEQLKVINNNPQSYQLSCNDQILNNRHMNHSRFEVAQVNKSEDQIYANIPKNNQEMTPHQMELKQKSNQNKKCLSQMRKNNQVSRIKDCKKYSSFQHSGKNFTINSANQIQQSILIHPINPPLYLLPQSEQESAQISIIESEKSNKILSHEYQHHQLLNDERKRTNLLQKQLRFDIQPCQELKYSRKNKFELNSSADSSLSKIEECIQLKRRLQGIFLSSLGNFGFQQTLNNNINCNQLTSQNENNTSQERDTKLSTHLKQSWTAEIDSITKINEQDQKKNAESAFWSDSYWNSSLCQDKSKKFYTFLQEKLRSQIEINLLFLEQQMISSKSQSQEELMEKLIEFQVDFVRQSYQQDECIGDLKKRFQHMFSL